MPQCRWKWRYPHFPSERKCHPGRPAWLQTGWAGYETPRMSQGSNVIVDKTKMTCKSTITVPSLAPGLQLKLFSRLTESNRRGSLHGVGPMDAWEFGWINLKLHGWAHHQFLHCCAGFNTHTGSDPQSRPLSTKKGCDTGCWVTH